MLASKFHGFITDRILHNASKLPLCTHHLKLLDQTLRYNWSNKSDNNILKNRSNPYETCKQNVEALARRSKTARALEHHENQNLLQKCEVITIVSEFEEARKRVNDLIVGITKLFNDEKQTIVESLRKEAKVDKDDLCRWLRDISDSIDQKLKHLIKLDPYIGSEVRVTVLRFKDHARNTFITLHLELAPCVKQIESILEKIHNEITQCLQKAAALTLLCRCNGSPSFFKKCILQNTAKAEKILEQTMEEAKIKLRDVKKLRDYMLKCHRDMLIVETNHHTTEMKALSRYLDDYAAALKRQTK